MPMPALGLFSVEDPSKKAAQYYSAASGTYGAMDKEEKIEKPDKTIGGGLMSGGGGAVSGAMIGSMFGGGAAAGGGAAGAAAAGAAATSWAGPGALIGAGIGALAYFLS
jgi:hypothetical protein